MSKITFGVFVPFYALQQSGERNAKSLFAKIKEIFLECERLGYHSAWLDDHLMFGKSPIFECWTTLSALASVTNRIRLGTMVTSSAFRNPALLAKMAATVDVISNGRLEFGIGSGVQKEEHAAYGFSFPEAATRISRMKETLEIVKALWTQDKATFNGEFYQIAQAICEPKPVQKPYPPITIGGSGEKLVLKVTAQYADRMDFGYQPTMQQYQHKLEILENHCKSTGRDFSEIEKSSWPAGQIVLGRDAENLDKKVRLLKPSNMRGDEFEKISFVGTPDKFASLIRPYVDLGVAHFMLFFGDLPDFSGLRLFAEAVAPQFR